MSTEVISCLYLSDEARARQAASELTQTGYHIEVRTAATGPPWLTLAKIDMAPSLDNIAIPPGPI